MPACASRWQPDGSSSASLDLTESVYSLASSIRIAPSGQPILVSIELRSGDISGAQALVVRRLAQP